ncbi:MAG: glycosyltransferase family 2 protein [Bacillota bacterium]
MPDKSVTVMIPAYNEEKTIGDTVRSAWRIPGVIQVLVIDDGSKDRTAGAALNSGAEVMALNTNRGKGGALTAGAGLVKGEILVLLDADLGRSAAQAEKLIGPVKRGEADMTVAVFPSSPKKSGFGLVKGLARAGIRHYTGLLVEAPLSGQRAMRRAVFLDCLPLAGGYGMEVDLTVRAGLKGYRISEVPVNMSHRETGRDIKGFIHRGRQFCHVAMALLALKKPGCGNA